MAGEATTIIDIISNTGLIGLLVLIIIGGAKRIWVFGWVYESMRQEKEEWKEVALSGTVLAERAVDAATTAVVRGKRTRTKQPNQE